MVNESLRNGHPFLRQDNLLLPPSIFLDDQTLACHYEAVFVRFAPIIDLVEAVLSQMSFGLLSESSTEHRESEHSPVSDRFYDTVSIVGSERAYVIFEIVCYLVHDGVLSSEPQTNNISLIFFPRFFTFQRIPEKC